MDASTIQSRIRNVSFEEGKEKHKALMKSIIAAESLEYVSDEFSFNTKGYHQGQNAVAQHVIEEAESEDREREKTGYDNNEPESKAAIVSNGTWMGALFMALMAVIHPLV